MAANIFEELLDLENQFYQVGLRHGLDDGAHAGKVEGRTFGLEQGFKKYKESGRLYGKSLVWANRMSHFRVPQVTASESTKGSLISTDQQSIHELPLLPNKPRLTKQIETLYALTESESLAIENTEDAVTSFDDRLKRALAKAKVIEKVTGEGTLSTRGTMQSSAASSRNIEDVSR